MTVERLGLLRSLNIDHLSQVTGVGIVTGLERYINEECQPAFPSFESSLRLTQKLKESGLVERMVEAERAGPHSLLSHSLLVCNYTTEVGRQLNQVSQSTIGSSVVDEPLLVTSAFAHDLGNLITSEDVAKWELDKVDLTPYTNSYPSQSPWRRMEGNHILKTIALLTVWGFPEHANTVAHSIHHLLNSDSKTIERVLLMLADMSVIDMQTPGSDGLKTAYAVSLVHKMDQALSRHRGEVEVYLSFHDQLQTIKSYLEDAGVTIPGSSKSDSIIRESGLSSLLNYLTYRNIKRMSLPSS